jgi:hypothetical protein
MISDKILQYITEDEKKREYSSPLRMSASGSCQRQIAYKLHKFPSTPLPGRAILTMDFGNRVEQQLVEFAEKYKDRLKNEFVELEIMKDEITFEICGQTITGHVDGILTNEGEQYLWECKSITDQGFKFIQRLGPKEEHLRQATSYMKALGLKKTIFTYYNRNLAQPLDIKYNFDEKVWREVEQRFTNVIKSTKDVLPDREYGPNDKGKLPWQCGYCAFNTKCWPNLELTFDKSGKPVLRNPHGNDEAKTNTKQRSLNR